MKALRYILLLPLALIAGSQLPAQQKMDSSYRNTYYQGRMEWFQSLGGQKGAIVFLGNSITERGQWHELLPGKMIMNRGIGGDNTFGVLARLDDIIRYRPKKLFLLIGINDIGRGLPLEVIAQNYRRMVARIKEGAPGTQLYVQSVLPLNERLLQAAYLKNKKDSVLRLNEAIRQIAADAGVTYVDLHPLFADEQGALKEAYTADGIHLRPSAYVDWVAFLKGKKYI